MSSSSNTNMQVTEIGKEAQRPPVAGIRSGSAVSAPNDAHKIVADLEEGTNQSALEAVGLGAALFAGIQFAKPRVPAIARLPNSARTLLTVGPPVLWYLYSNVATSRNSKKLRHHATHGVAPGTGVFTQAADVTHQRQDLNLSFFQRSQLWVADNPLGGVGVLGGPLVAYGIYINKKYPDLKFTQKVMRSSVLGQVTVLSTLGLFAAFSYNYEPPHQAAKATLRKHMTSVSPRDREQAPLVHRRSSVRQSQQQQKQEATH